MCWKALVADWRQHIAEHPAFTKEVQWRIPFMTAPATMEELAETVPVTVDVQMQPQAEAIVSAPVDGIVRAPRVYSSGSNVRRGQTLASISSTLGGGEDVATLELAINEASIARGIRHAYREERLVVEGAAAVGIAALLDDLIQPRGPVVVVISGRNIDIDQHLRLINGAEA